MNKRQKELLKHQLTAEEKELRELKKIYREALNNIDDNIAKLLGRADSDLQHVIYRLDYQRALKSQISGILDEMNTKQFESITDYIADSYTNGFVGSFYNMSSEGIPLIVPIDQKQVIKAMKTETKLSEGLYKELGKDTNELKKRISGALSRGIASGQGYNEIARNIANESNIGFNKAVRIARTEGARVYNTGTYDACIEAKNKGANVVKQWNSTLDGNTRHSHRRIDGEIRELDEKFSNGLMYPCDPAGKAEDVINCRCALMQRAKWALDEEELETLKERAAYFGLDKTENFEAFKNKYLKAAKTLKTLENVGKDSIIISGAISGARNPLSSEAKEHAERYYGLVRSMTTDVAKIAETTGFTEAEVQAVKDFIFNEKHDLGDGVVDYFAPDYMMAESWRRLIDGKPEEHDITLLMHEIMERRLMLQGMTQDEAHRKTSAEYNYSEEAKKYYAEIEKHKKE